MTEQEILDFYNDNWTDYNSIMDLLHKMIDEHEREISNLHKELREVKKSNSSSKELDELKKLLRECQDNLDEERHKL